MFCEALTGEEGGGVGGREGKPGRGSISQICPGASVLASWETSSGDPNCPGLEIGVLPISSPFCFIIPSSRRPPPLVILTGEEVGGVGGEFLSSN
jgi:hypothetical protein